MKPNDLYEELASIVVGVVKRPFRPEPVTKEEYSEILYRIMRLVEKQEEAANGDAGSKRQRAS